MPGEGEYSPGVPQLAVRPGSDVVPPGWTVRRIPSGLWLHGERIADGRAGEVAQIGPDPARPVVVADPGPDVLRAVAAVLGLLPGSALRLVLPGVSGSDAQEFADRYTVDLVATSGLVGVAGPLTVAWGFSEQRPATFWQWFRFRPGLPVEPLGAIYPSPPWETALSTMPEGAVRIAAGLAVGRSTGFLRYAAAIPPDPERLTVAIDDPEAMSTLAVFAGSRLRLWPVTRAYEERLRRLCAQYGIDALAPVEPHGRWSRFTPDGRVEAVVPCVPGEAAPVGHGESFVDPAALGGISGAGEPGGHAKPHVGNEPGGDDEPGADGRVTASPLIAPGHRSDAEERRRHRESVGPAANRHLVAVARALVRYPEIGGEPEGAIAADLSSVFAYLTGDLPDLDEELRVHATGSRPGADTMAHTACVMSGLRRLPPWRGPAYLTADLRESDLSRYVPGAALFQPCFTTATIRHPAAAGNTLYAIWSHTGRWAAPLVEDDLVIFPAGSVFVALAAERLSTAHDRWIIYLRERTGPYDDDAILGCLRGAVFEADSSAPAIRFSAPLGLDDTGRHFVPLPVTAGST